MLRLYLFFIRYHIMLKSYSQIMTMKNGYVQALTWKLISAYGQRGIAAPKLYKKEEWLTLRKYSSSFGEVLVAHLFSFVCGVPLYVFTFWVPSCDVH